MTINCIMHFKQWKDDHDNLLIIEKFQQNVQIGSVAKVSTH